MEAFRRHLGPLRHTIIDQERVINDEKLRAIKEMDGSSFFESLDRFPYGFFSSFIHTVQNSLPQGNENFDGPIDVLNESKQSGLAWNIRSERVAGLILRLASGYLYRRGIFPKDAFKLTIEQLTGKSRVLRICQKEKLSLDKDWIIVSTDGSCKNGRGGAGFVGKDYSGKILFSGCSTGKTVVSNHLAEGFGVECGLEEAHSRGWKKLVLELDSKSIYDKLGMSDKEIPASFRKNMKEANFLFKYNFLETIKVSIWRETNSASDFLASMSHNLTKDKDGVIRKNDRIAKTWDGKVPIGLKSLLADDAGGIVPARIRKEDPEFLRAIEIAELNGNCEDGERVKRCITDLTPHICMGCIRRISLVLSVGGTVFEQFEVFLQYMDHGIKDFEKLLKNYSTLFEDLKLFCAECTELPPEYDLSIQVLYYEKKMKLVHGIDVLEESTTDRKVQRPALKMAFEKFFADTFFASVTLTSYSAALPLVPELNVEEVPTDLSPPAKPEYGLMAIKAMKRKGA